MQLGRGIEKLEDRTLMSATPIMVKPIFVTEQPFQTSAPQGLTPDQIRHAYGFDQITFGGTIEGDGTGQTIAIIDAFDSPTIQNDLHQFSLQFGIPDAPSFIRLAQDGTTNYPTTDPTGGWEGETALDVEWVHALAPNANIILIEADTNSNFDLETATDFARNLPDVSVITMSFGGGEDVTDPSTNSLYTTPLGHQGITFLASTGDSGAPGGYPAFSPNVVAVGGTTLSVDGAGNYISESGWDGSGGGISQLEAQPAYQTGVVTQTSLFRTIPDVSFDADPASGVPVYDTFNNSSATPWEQVGGTSFSAPAWAAIIAIANQGRELNGLGTLDGPTETLPLLYRLPQSDFHDVTTGNNGFAAGPGYDLVTGRGTPRLPLLIPGLTGSNSISGRVFNDLNGNGTQDSGEAGLSGWTVYLDLNHDGQDASTDPSVVTDVSGNYSFSALAAGAYRIAEVVQPGYLQTGPVGGFYDVTLVNGQSISGKSFGDRRGSISGTVFSDHNQNGTRDPGENGLSGWTVYEDANHNGKFDSGTAQTFVAAGVPLNLPDVSTTISSLFVTGQTGSIDNLTITLDITHTFDSDLTIQLISPSGTIVTLADREGQNGDNFTGTTFSDAASTPIFFGSAPFTGTFIPETPLSDLDGGGPNGVWQLVITDNASGDFGTLNSWSLNLTAGFIDPHTVSDANGDYTLSDLNPGNYRIGEVLQTGYTQTAPIGGFANVTLATGQVVNGVDFGNFIPPALILNSATTDGGLGLQLTYTIANGPAQPFDLGIFQTLSSQFDTSATKLGSVFLSLPADLSTGVHTLTITIGSGLGQIPLPGVGVAESSTDYYLLAQADDLNPVVGVNHTALITGAYHAPGSPIFVQGTDGIDLLTSSQPSLLGKFTLTLNGVGGNYSVADVASLRVRMHADDDTLNIPTLPIGAFVLAGAGDDSLTGGTGNDTLVGGDGDNLLKGGDGSDVYVFANSGTAGFDTVQEVPALGTDVLDFSAVTSSVVADLSSDATLGTYANRVVRTAGSGQAASFEGAIGGTANNILLGNAADNLLVGRGLNDTLDGISGNDSLTGGVGNETFVFHDATGPQVVTLTQAFAQGVNTLDFSAVTSSLSANLLAPTVIAIYSNVTVQTPVSGQGGSFSNLIGGSGDDSLVSNAGDDKLVGNAGNDTLIGNGGHDTLSGGFGSNVLQGGPGNNTYLFGDRPLPATTDTLIQASGTSLNTLDFSSVTQPVVANLTSDTSLATYFSSTIKTAAVGQALNFSSVIGGSGINQLTGNSGNNRLVAGAGGSTLSGGGGNDTLIGGLGNDVFLFGNTSTPQTDVIEKRAGQGSGTLDFSAVTTALTVSLASPSIVATYANMTVQTLLQGEAAFFQTVIGGSGTNYLVANNGRDSLIGHGGDDTFIGGSGNDTFVGGGGNDLFLAGTGDSNYVFSNTPNPQTATTTTTVTTHRRRHTIVTHKTVTTTSPYVSTIVQNPGGTNTLDFSAVSGALTVNLGSDTGLASYPNRVVKTAAAGMAANIQNVIGGTGNASIIGNAADNILVGNGKQDTLKGGSGGNDILVGRTGNELLVGSPGRNLLIGGSGASTLSGGNSEDIIIGGSTIYDSSLASLQAIRTEWVRTDVNFQQRLDHLRGTVPGGLNGPVVLTPSTVTNSPRSDSLSGGTSIDWYWANVGLDIFAPLGNGSQIN